MNTDKNTAAALALLDFYADLYRESADSLLARDGYDFTDRDIEIEANDRCDLSVVVVDIAYKHGANVAEAFAGVIVDDDGECFDLDWASLTAYLTAHAVRVHGDAGEIKGAHYDDEKSARDWEETMASLMPGKI